MSQRGRQTGWSRRGAEVWIPHNDAIATKVSYAAVLACSKWRKKLNPQDMIKIFLLITATYIESTKIVGVPSVRFCVRILILWVACILSRIISFGY